MTLYRRHKSRPPPRKRTAKWLSEKALQRVVKKKKKVTLRAKEKRKDIPTLMQSSIDSKKR